MRVALTLLCLVVLLSVPALAEDPPSSEFEEGKSVPPPMPEGPDAYLGPAENTDPIAWLRTLEEQFRRMSEPPPSTANVTALRDAWDAILKPRVPAMTRRVSKWTDLGKWATDDDGLVPTHLEPDQWTYFIRDMARLATELHGSWKQYGSVEVRPKLRQQGYAPPPPQVPYLYLNYGYPVLYRGILDRQRAAASLGHGGWNTYWRLLGRYQYAWDWSYFRRRALYENWQERREATDELFEEIYAEFDATQDNLAQTLLGLQVYVAALQSAEEQRLAGHCQACRSDDATLRMMAETALVDMAKARLEAERYQGDSSAAWGTLLRRWLRLQKAASKVLDLSHEPLDPPPAEEDDG